MSFAPKTTVSSDRMPRVLVGGAASELRPFDVLRNYQLLKRLGGGGMAEVWLARATLGEGVDKLVAFKTVRPEFGTHTQLGAMFLNEAKISATLQHPSLVQVFDFGEAAGRPFLGMERVQGRDLAAVIQRLHGQIELPPVNFAVAVVLELVKALEHVHQQKDLDGRPLALVHRDVTPGNVMLTPRGEVKLMDFGVASSATDAAAGIRVGKLPYMSPEQAAARTPAPAWDLFGAAVVLYELLTLRRPFGVVVQPDSSFPRYDDLRAPPSKANPDVPPELDALVARATDLEPSRRLQSASELRAALEALQAQVGLCDIGAKIGTLFGPQLAEEETEVAALMAEARRRAPQAGSLSVLLRPLRAVRRRVASTTAWTWLGRHPRTRRALGLGLVVALVGGGALGFTVVSRELQLRRTLEAADVDARAGRAGEAIEQLLPTRERAPSDPRVTARLRMLADLMAELGAGALARGNDAEASAHFKAALRADPALEGAKARLAEIEGRAREASRKSLVGAP